MEATERPMLFVVFGKFSDNTRKYLAAFEDEGTAKNYLGPRGYELVSKEVATYVEVPSGDKVKGHVEVGVNDNGEVVLNLGKDLVGHIVFSPRQAENLATLLADKASEGRKVQRPLQN